jgi:hypothetical protein
MQFELDGNYKDKTRGGVKNKEIWKRSTQKKNIVHARTYQQPEETRFVLFKKK